MYAHSRIPADVIVWPVGGTMPVCCKSDGQGRQLLKRTRMGPAQKQGGGDGWGHESPLNFEGRYMASGKRSPSTSACLSPAGRTSFILATEPALAVFRRDAGYVVIF